MFNQYGVLYRCKEITAGSIDLWKEQEHSKEQTWIANAVGKALLHASRSKCAEMRVSYFYEF